MSSKDLVTRGEADSVAGHVGGWSFITSDTSTQYVDLQAWIGRYVKLVFQGQSFRYCWGSQNDIPNAATYLVTGASPSTPAQGATMTRGVCDVGFAPGSAFEIPMMEAPVLFFKSDVAGGQITVLPK